jgi:hypothetical protein
LIKQLTKKHAETEEVGNAQAENEQEEEEDWRTIFG